MMKSIFRFSHLLPLITWYNLENFSIQLYDLIHEDCTNEEVWELAFSHSDLFKYKKNTW